MHPLLVNAYRTELRPLSGFLWKLGAPASDLEDVLHDVFLTAMQRWEQYQPSRPLRPWLFGIAYHVFANRRRKGARTSPSAELGERGSEELAKVEHRRAVEQVLAPLAEEQRSVFVMHELEGMTAPEISEVMGAPLGTTYSRLRLAKLAVTEAVRKTKEREAS